jgi:hypothetical protein
MNFWHVMEHLSEMVRWEALKSCFLWGEKIENSFGAWFSLGVNKRKLPYHAAIRPHNFMMDTENLSYSATESVDNLYHNYYKF